MSILSLPHESPRQATDGLFLEAAGALGARLCRDALWAGHRCNWLGDSMEFVGSSWTLAHRAFGPTLYEGTSGLALFLARLYRATREPLYRRTAEGAARQAISRLSAVPDSGRIGFYSGLTGIAYALLALGEIFEESHWITEAIGILDSLQSDDAVEQGLDVVAGSAGAIPALLDIDGRYSKDFLLDLAIRHGEHLLAAARQGEDGWSWDTLRIPCQRDLTGFSHGAAGIAWALLELWRATGQERFRTAALQGFAYERRWFSPAEENWPDFRNLDASSTPGTTPVCALAWCHGAPGIGLSRLRAFAITGEPTYRAEAEAAIRTTWTMLDRAAFADQSNYSLCHGNAGNAELLIYAASVLGDSKLKAAADEVGFRGIARYPNNLLPWPCGVLGGGETPNLMLGLAGIGDFYLRLHDPAAFSSLLIIVPERPVGTGAR